MEVVLGAESAQRNRQTAKRELFIFAENEGSPKKVKLLFAARLNDR
jgi:hypothetical protein